MSAAVSDALVLFGITGDLAYKKIFPALYAMAVRGEAAVPIVGVASSEHTTETLVARARASLTDAGVTVDDGVFAAFAARTVSASCSIMI